MTDAASSKDLGMTATIVTAYISKNHLAADALPALIQSVYRTLATVGEAEPPPAALKPAVPIRKSVFPSYLVCLEDGKKLKMLKRHLANSYGMTPGEYRTKWGVPDNYPMVASDYASRRSALAKEIGLGGKPKTRGEPEAAKPTQTESAVTKVPARRARGSKG